MTPTRVAILGIGNLRTLYEIVGALATYFGERPLEVALWDADAERLDLFFHFLRFACTFNQNEHRIFASDDPAEMAAGASHVVICPDRNCAFRYLRSIGRGSDPIPAHTSAVGAACLELMSFVPEGASILEYTGEPVRLATPLHYRLDVPPELATAEKQAIPYDIMRWLRGEDFLHGFLRDAERSPLKTWLENPSIATLVSED